MKIPPPATWPPLAAVGLAGVFAVKVATSFDGWDSFLFAGKAIVVGLVVALLVALRNRLMMATTGRHITVHTEGGHGPKVAADHEGGHIAVTLALGGKVRSAVIRPDGSGEADVWLPKSAGLVGEVAVDVAGRIASGTSAGCSSDEALTRGRLRGLPSKEQAAIKRAGTRKATSVCKGLLSDGGVSKYSKQLLRDGKI